MNIIVSYFHYFKKIYQWQIAHKKNNGLNN
jgi:hypothetical protein